MRAVVDAGWTPADRAALDAEARRVLGPAIRFEFSQVADITPTAAGKFRVVVGLDSPSSEVGAIRSAPSQPLTCQSG
jgi:hypothetical protein